MRAILQIVEHISAAPITLANNLNHQEFFARIADKPWSMWLDSGDSNHVDSRYDIIVWQPDITLTTADKCTQVNYFDNQGLLVRKATSEQEPLSLLRSIQNEAFLDVKLANSKLPFSGGAVGYFGYDLGRQFECLPALASRDINAPDMAVGIYMHALVFDRDTQELTLVCIDSERDILTEQINSLINQAKNTGSCNEFHLTTDWQPNMSQAQYNEKFQHIQQYLLSGDCYQINLAQRFNAQYAGDEFGAYLTLRNANKAPFSAFMRTDTNAVLSISPERFLQVNISPTGKAKVQTKPIKGTMPRALDKDQDIKNAEILANSTKDRAENLMIVDLLRNDLSRVCLPGTVKVPKLFDIESFPAVHHLVSTVEGQLSAEHTNTDLLRVSFPGGSITGAPKIRAMEIIEELEPHRRNVYCGSIGYLSMCGNMDTSITIRTLICENNQIYCWAGGGIVADSNAESEYQETFDKVEKILPLLNKLAKSSSPS